MLTAYLDSHHVSRLADGKSGLTGCWRQGAKFYFSRSHVIEAMPKGPTKINDSIARLTLITSPENLGLLPWTRILELEAAHGDSLSLEQINCPISEILMHGIDPAQFAKKRHWLRKAKDTFDERLSTINDVNQRRSMRAKIFKRGQFSPLAIELLRKQQKTVIDSASQAIPEMLPLFEKGGMYDLLCGKVSEQQYGAIFMKVAGNPVVLAKLIAYPEFDSIMDISKFFWNESDRMAQRVTKLIQGLIAIQIKSGAIPFSELRAGLAETIASQNFRVELASIFASQPMDTGRLCKLPGTSLFVDCLIEYIFEKIEAYANAKSPLFASEIKFKRSDFADLTHLVYAPYVSVFGCDSGTRDKVRKAGYEITKLATSDAEFMARLAEARASV